MAVPKRKTSRSKTKLRRTHHKIKLPTLSACSECGHLKRPAHVCPNCGYYKNVKVDEKADH